MTEGDGIVEVDVGSRVAEFNLAVLIGVATTELVHIRPVKAGQC